MNAELPPGLRLEHPVPGVVSLVLARPHCRNAFNSEIASALPALLESVAADPSVGAVVLAGDGGAFSAGADLDVLERGGFTTASLLDAFQAVRLLREMPQPVIAAVDGPAVGGGFGLALACDIRLASPRAMFCATFIEMGLVPDYGLSTTLPRIVGAAAALEVLLSGRYVGAAEALDLGLVLRIVDDPRAVAVELAEAFARRPRQAVAQTKRLVHRGMDDELTSVLQSEARHQVAALNGSEFASCFSEWHARIVTGPPRQRV